jgi:aminocarboxymuconate-semialdehyde decarboxylase
MRPSPRIDVHCHFVPPTLIERIRSDGGAHGLSLVERPGGEAIATAGRVFTRPVPEGMLDLENRLRWMDERGIDVQVLSAWIDFTAYLLDPEDGVWLARSLDELTVEAIRGREDRFRAMAGVPLQAPDLAAETLRYAVRDLGMVGVEIATSVAGRDLDWGGLDPFWAEASGLSTAVLVHPEQAVRSERFSRYFLSNAVDNASEETLAATHLIFGGVLERFPDLKVCLTHGGGFLPYQIGRQDRAFAAVPDKTAVLLRNKPSSFLRRFLYDTIVHSPEALRFLEERVGHDRVVLGSDYPFPMGDPDPVESVARAGFSPEVQRSVLGGNAIEWFGLHDAQRREDRELGAQQEGAMTEVTTPLGTVVQGADDARRLEFRRRYQVPIQEVWSAVTESDRLARWLGSYEGVGAAGGSVTLTMTAAEDAGGEPATVHILECEPPLRLVVDVEENERTWRIRMTLSETSGTTTLLFAQTMPSDMDPADVGPGWHWYLDRLAASLADAPMPQWEDYPALASHYR